MTASPVSLLPAKRSKFIKVLLEFFLLEFSYSLEVLNLNRETVNRMSNRLDAIEGGISGMSNAKDSVIQDVNSKWTEVIKPLDKNLLRRKNHPLLAIDRLLNKYGYVNKKRVSPLRRRKDHKYEYDYDNDYDYEDDVDDYYEHDVESLRV